MRTVVQGQRCLQFIVCKKNKKYRPHSTSYLRSDPIYVHVYTKSPHDFKRQKSNKSEQIRAVKVIPNFLTEI